MLVYFSWIYANLLILEPYTPVPSQGRDVTLRRGGAGGGVYLGEEEWVQGRLPQELAQGPGCSY